MCSECQSTLYYRKRDIYMKHTELGKLTAARCTLTIMASGMKIHGVRVRDVAEVVGAPKVTWRARTLLKWVEEKMILTS